MNNYELLCSINKKYDKETPNIRYSLEEIKELINELNNSDSKEFNIDNLLRICIKLYNSQLFYDANTRTMYDFINMYLKKYNLKLDTDKIKKDYPFYRTYFPTLYSIDEEINNKILNKMKEYIKGDENNDHCNCRTYRRR